MKIQIEPRKDIIDIKPSLDRITYVSYQSYREVIPKAPEDVRLSDVKNALPETADLEHYYKTKDSIGNIICIEVENDKQSIPLLDGMIELETVPKTTKVEYRILDEKRNWITNFRLFHRKVYGVIPISMKKSKTLKDVKEAVPDFLQKPLQDGKSIKYLFEDETINDGVIKTELILDSEEIPVIKDREKIICWIKVSSDVCKKLKQLTNILRLKILLSILFAWSVTYFSNHFYPSSDTTILLTMFSLMFSMITFFVFLTGGLC